MKKKKKRNNTEKREIEYVINAFIILKYIIFMLCYIFAMIKM